MKILIIEDEQMIRETLLEMLQLNGHTVLAAADGPEGIKLSEQNPDMIFCDVGLPIKDGYQVLAAGTPGAALEFLATHRDEIALLLTDLVMPQMNGRELAARVKQDCPGVGVVLMSGYASGLATRLEDGTEFVRKPLVRAELASKLRAALEATRRAKSR